MVAEQSVAGQLSLPTAMKKNNKLIRPEADRIACNIWNSLLELLEVSVSPSMNIVYHLWANKSTFFFKKVVI